MSVRTDPFTSALGDTRGVTRSAGEAAFAWERSMREFAVAWDAPTHPGESVLRRLAADAAGHASDLDRALRGERGHGLREDDFSFDVDETEPSFPVLLAVLFGAPLGAIAGNFSSYDRVGAVTKRGTRVQLTWELLLPDLLSFNSDTHEGMRVTVLTAADAPAGTDLRLPWQHAAWMSSPETIAAAQHAGARELLTRLHKRIALGGENLI